MFKYPSSCSSCGLEQWVKSKWSFWSNELDWWTVWLNGSFSPSLLELKSGELSESPLVRNDDSLSSGEFVLGSSEGFQGGLDVLLIQSDGVEDWSDFDSGNLSVRLTKGLSHTGLESISSSTWQHLIDSDDVPWVDSASQVEVILSNVLG